MIMSKPLIIIPARMDSKRLPGKPLLMAGNKPLIRHTYERAMKTGYDVKIVTPDKELMLECRKFTKNAYHHKTDAANGTARCADFVNRREWESPNIIINWQCDEPSVEYDSVVKSVAFLEAFGSHSLKSTVATLVYPALPAIESEGAVYAACEGRCCYWFSRMPMAGASNHIGVYVFTKQSLHHASVWVDSELGTAENLEQLPWLQNGIKIIALTSRPTLAVNTQLDFDAFKVIVESGAYAN